mmetsp:Transcript_27684/g.81363  ORF Transcript_27684/g.81363 Transcript_27684/m.81363 type:complete len:235 (-) Transcript_27684:949-1653(-)
MILGKFVEVNPISSPSTLSANTDTGPTVKKYAAHHSTFYPMRVFIYRSPFSCSAFSTSTQEHPFLCSYPSAFMVKVVSSVAKTAASMNLVTASPHRKRNIPNGSSSVSALCHASTSLRVMKALELISRLVRKRGSVPLDPHVVSMKFHSMALPGKRLMRARYSLVKSKRPLRYSLPASDSTPTNCEWYTMWSWAMWGRYSLGFLKQESESMRIIVSNLSTAGWYQIPDTQNRII